jgi:hypothetical protein
MNQEHFSKAVAFGKQMIKTGDLDPVYIALYDSQFNTAQVARWMLAYSCLYHLAASVYISERKGQDFWNLLEKAAINEGLKWPRGSERRHWRGHSSIECVNWIRLHFKQPEEVMKDWATPTFGDGTLTCANVLHNVQQFPYYGPWISFKVADLLDRVAGVKVDFTNFELGVYSEPRKGAALLLSGDTEQKITDGELRSVTEALGKALGPLKAPPDYKRRINVQEIETVLCKYKSHVGGHYPPGKDTLEVYHGLQDERFTCKSVKRLLTIVTPLWGQWA